MKLCVLLESTEMMAKVDSTRATTLIVLCLCKPVNACNEIIRDLADSSLKPLSSSLSEHSWNSSASLSDNGSNKNWYSWDLTHLCPAPKTQSFLLPFSHQCW
ncbi:hypothetical protein V6Z12_A05G393500 [Gossypium hirsutum]